MAYGNESPKKIVRIMFLDFRKAFDLINHNVLLENFMQIAVRPAVVGWFASYLYNRSQVTSFQGEQSDCKRIKGGVPQGSKLGHHCKSRGVAATPKRCNITLIRCNAELNTVRV
jgi:hypothetical protein